MKYRELGNSGISVSVVGLGTWAIGGGPWWGTGDENDSIRAIHASIDGGINLIDTAPGYGFGYSETIVGKAIADRRDKVVLSTKCGLWWDSDTGNYFFSLDGKDIHRCLKPATIITEVDRSLQRLGTDYIDILHTHWQDVTTPIEETAACLESLRKSGKIRSIAVSNATTDDMDKYFKECTIVANQAKYSILDTAIETTIADYCVEKNVGILAYSPLEQGLLTGKVTLEHTYEASDTRSSNPWFELSKRAKVLAFLDKLAPFTQKYNCTTAQLIIAWTFEQFGITSVLCGARKVNNADENLAAGDLSLDKEDIIKIRELAKSAYNR